MALVAQVITLDKFALADRCGKLPSEQVELILSRLDIVLGRGEAGWHRPLATSHARDNA